MRSHLARTVLTVTAVLAIAGGLVPAAAQGEPVVCPAPTASPTFAQSYIDTTRAGGEPIIATHPDGTLLWGSHAGTTHFFSPAAPEGNIAPFVQEYEGQTYYYFSEDDGETWTFAPRSPFETVNPTSGLPLSGFSDPEFAIDTAGNVYISEINLANVAVSKSTDSGRTYTLQNFFGLTASDRQWMEADTEDVLYMVANTFAGGSLNDPIPGVSGSLGNRIYKSTDGGVTFSEGQATADGAQASSDIKVDQSDGRIYQLQSNGDVLEMAIFPDARDEMPPGLTIERFPIVTGFDRGTTIGPTMDLDAEGNVYVTWDEGGAGDRPAGVYFASSTDRGQTWSQPVRVDTGGETDIWPWVVAGEPGTAAVVWLQNEAELTGATPSESTDAGDWHVMAAQSFSALGCAGGDVAGFTVTRASTEPVHTGTICNGGTTCQATATDRRLGDYFSHETDADGNIVIAVSDTRQGGPVSLPLVIRQVGGPTLTQLVQDLPLQPGCTLGGDGDVVRRLDTDRPTSLGVAASTACGDTAEIAVLARDDLFADALAATGLAGVVDAPVLLTPTDTLDAEVSAELERLGVEEVVIAGGPAAVSVAVEQQLRDAGYAVTRIGGDERFETAALIADELVARDGPVTEAIIALGSRPDGADPWPDALTAGVLSGTTAAPVLLVTPDTVPGTTADALDRLLEDGAQVAISGGTAAIGQDVAVALADLGYEVARLAGADRYGTSSAVVGRALGAGAGLDVVILASGQAFQGPLVSGAAALRGGGVMLLVDPDDLDSGATTRQFLTDNADRIGQVLIAGDASVISDAVEAQVREILGAG